LITRSGSARSVAELQAAQRIAPVTSLQPPYSLIRRGIEDEVLPYTEREDIGVIVYSPMASGLLTGAMTRERIRTLSKEDWRSQNPEFQEPKLTDNLALVERLRAVGARHGRTAGEVAIAWTLHHPAVTAAIVGARNPGQLNGIVGAANLHLSDEEIVEIEGTVRAVA
jgi:aryl-alcohol dehydrogenase-like predicted oxidoreductase